MTAGVHDTNSLSAIRACDFRPERQIDLLRHRQCVHVRAQRNHWSRLSAAQNPDDAMHSTNLSLHFHAERAQMCRHQSGRAYFIAGQFRMLMNIALPSDHLRHYDKHAPLNVIMHRRHVHGALRTQRSRQHAGAQCASQERPNLRAHRRHGRSVNTHWNREQYALCGLFTNPTAKAWDWSGPSVRRSRDHVCHDFSRHRKRHALRNGRESSCKTAPEKFS